MPEFKTYLQAGYPALYVQTLEPSRAIETLSPQVIEAQGIPFVWDLQNGVVDQSNGEKIPNQADPNAALQSLSDFPENAVLFAWNFQHFLDSIEIIQAIQNGLDAWKSRGQCLVVLASELKLPVELERVFTLIEFELPGREALKTILKDIAASASLPMPEEIEHILNAAKGLTTFEAENAFALSALDAKPFAINTIASQKAQMVKKNASIDILESNDRFKDLGGLEQLKSFSLQIAPSPLARGLLLLGVPGCGKSHFAKALGGEMNVPTLSLDFGRLFGSLVGQSEARIRQALAVADAMAPCVLMIDEIDKGLSGAGSSHQSDGGVGSRIFGTFLSWLNDHTSQVFVVATTNNISQLPAEFLRAERWDGIFFVDLPTKEEREAILKIHAKTYDLTLSDLPDMSAWSGAEIKSLCRITAMTSTTLKEAAKYVVPLSRSMGEKLKTLRDWAKSRTIPASISVMPERMRKIAARIREN